METMTWATVDWQMQRDSSRRISFRPLKSKEVHQWEIRVRKENKKAPEGFLRLREMQPSYENLYLKVPWEDCCEEQGVNADKSQRQGK